MIKIIRGDLLHATEDIIGHQVNCMGAMNSGVAKSIREAHPIVYTEYKKLVDDTVEGEESSFDKDWVRRKLLGQVQGIDVGENKIIANMFGQFGYGYDKVQYTDETALYEALKTVRIVAEKNNYSVALPYMIGCYRGGADWKIVEDLILTAFDGYEVTLYKLHRG